MEKISILSEDKIITLATNQEQVKKYMISHKNNSWLKKVLKESNPFVASKIQMVDFEMDMSEKDPVKTDCGNAIKLYESLKHITPSQACDERLWVGLAFGKLYDYMQYRWAVTDKKKDAKHFKYRWMFHTSARRALMYQGLSKLWWFVHLTIDLNNAEDPYYLTKHFAQRIKMYEHTFFRNFSSSKHIRMAIYKTIYKLEQSGKKPVSRKMIEDLLKYMSFLGGAYILDSFLEDELKEKIIDKLNSLYEEELLNKKAEMNQRGK